MSSATSHINANYVRNLFHKNNVSEDITENLDRLLTSLTICPTSVTNMYNSRIFSFSEYCKTPQAVNYIFDELRKRGFKVTTIDEFVFRVEFMVFDYNKI